MRYVVHMCGEDGMIALEAMRVASRIGFPSDVDGYARARQPIVTTRMLGRILEIEVRGSTDPCSKVRFRSYPNADAPHGREVEYAWRHWSAALAGGSSVDHFEWRAIEGRRRLLVSARLLEVFDDHVRHASVHPGIPVAPPSLVVEDDQGRFHDYSTGGRGVRILHPAMAELLTDASTLHACRMHVGVGLIVQMGPAPSFAMGYDGIDPISILNILRAIPEAPPLEA